MTGGREKRKNQIDKENRSRLIMTQNSKEKGEVEQTIRFEVIKLQRVFHRHRNCVHFAAARIRRRKSL